MLNTSELRALIVGTAPASDDQLSALAQETSEQLIERLKAHDARFNYQLLVSPDNHAVPSPPGVVFSVTRGRTTINAFARDVNALKLDPPSLKFQLKGAGIDKMRLFIETGHPQRFEAHELGRISTTFGAIDLEDHGVPTLSLAMSPLAKERNIPIRVTFGQGGDRVVYEYLLFHLNRSGSKEVELESDSNEPFRMTMVLREKDGSFAFQERTTGFSVRSADKWIRGLRALDADGTFEIYDLAAEKRLLRGRIIVESDFGYLSRYAAFFREACDLCDHFGVELQLRRPLTEADVEAFTFLRQLMDAGTITVEPITSTIEKGTGGLPEEIWSGKPLDLRLDHDGHRLSLMDTEVQTGPYSLTVAVRIQNADVLRPKWESAPEGALLQVTWEPLGPATVVKNAMRRDPAK